jgi:hypothetical protein
VGDILRPACYLSNQKPNFDHCGEWVFLTTSPYPHYTIAEQAVKDGWIVYKVRPLSKLYQGMWDDLITKEAEVVRIVGNVRGIAKNKKPDAEGIYQRPRSSKVDFKRVKPKGTEFKKDMGTFDRSEWGRKRKGEFDERLEKLRQQYTGRSLEKEREKALTEEEQKILEREQRECGFVERERGFGMWQQKRRKEELENRKRERELAREEKLKYRKAWVLKNCKFASDVLPPEKQLFGTP